MLLSDNTESARINQIIRSILANAGIIENKFIQVAEGILPYNMGTAIFLSGSPASGKSTIINNQLLNGGKVISADYITDIYKEVLNKRYRSLKTDEERKAFASLYDNKIPVDRNAPMTKEDVTYWYNLVHKKLGDFIYDANGNVEVDSATGLPKHEGLKSEIERIFIDTTRNNPRKQNIIFDITSEDEIKLVESIALMKDIGYYVGLICAVIGIDEALKRNEGRIRREPEDYIKRVHSVVYRDIPQSLRNGKLKALDEAWVVFTHNFKKDTKISKAYNGKPQEIFSKPGWSNNTAFKLIKTKSGKFLLPDEEIFARFKNIIGYDF